MSVDKVKTLYIHIGHYKTGTTALQVFLAKNTDLLRASDLSYVDANRIHQKHSDLAFSVLHSFGLKYLMHGYDNSTPYETMWKNVFEEVSSSKYSRHIVSSEELIRLGEFPDSQQAVLEIANLAKSYNINVKIICFLRKIESHIESWYNQLMKMRINEGINVNSNFPPIKYAWDSIERIHFDYKVALNCWIKAFGHDNLIIKQYYGGKKSKTFIYEQFLSIFDLKLNDSFKIESEDPNKRLDDTILHLLATSNRMNFGYGTKNNIISSYQEYLAKVYPNISRNKTNISSAARKSENWLNEATSNEISFNSKMSNLTGISREEDMNLKLMGFLFSELIQLRQSHRALIEKNNLEEKELKKRIDQLEIRLNNEQTTAK